MANPLAFISFDLGHDENEREQFCDQLTNSRTAFSVDDWSATLGTAGSDREKAVQGRIGRCDLMIILVGKKMGSSANVATEIQLAKKTNVPFLGVLVGGADESSDLPVGLAANRAIPLDWVRIASAVDQLMGEGKHHKFT